MNPAKCKRKKAYVICVKTLKITSFRNYFHFQYDSNLHPRKKFSIIFIDILIYLKILKRTLSFMKFNICIETA